MDHWFVTRPKRKLILVPELIKIFAATTEGKQWNRNRQIQLQFERALTDAGWKAQNISDDGSGGRTYAALLYMFGLWYEDEVVHMTNAAKEIINGISNPVAVMTKQLIDFQYPSPYSVKRNVNISRDIQLQPFRFILNMLLETEIMEITQQEIGFCLAPFAKKMKDVNLCAGKVIEFRQDEDKVIREALKTTGRDKTYLKDLGNTIVNQFEYSGYFEEDPDIKSLKIRQNKISEIKSFLAERRKTLLQNPDDKAKFQRRYGSGIAKGKDYSRSHREPMDISPNQRIVLEKFFVLTTQRPVFSIDDDIIYKISSEIGASSKFVRETLDHLPLNITGNEFEDTYLRLSSGGRSTATDFERKTSALIKEGFGLETLWVGSKPRHPDIIVFMNQQEHAHGIIDTKAYTDYSLPIDHRNKMAVNYVPGFETYTFQGIEYKLAFYSYVAGNYGSNIQNSFEELLGMTNIPGSYITAKDLLILYHMHKDASFSQWDLKKIFSCNKQIKPNEIKR